MRVPDITLPEGLARLVTKLPAAPPSWLFVKGLNQLVRRRVVPADMSLLAGRRFEIHVTDTGIHLCFVADATGFKRDVSGSVSTVATPLTPGSAASSVFRR